MKGTLRPSVKIERFVHMVSIFSQKKPAKPLASDASLPSGIRFPIGSLVRESNNPNNFFWLPRVFSTAVFKYRHSLALGCIYF